MKSDFTQISVRREYPEVVVKMWSSHETVS